MTVVVADATCLERNLNLVLQVQEITDNIVVCVNLMDEAGRKKISIDIEKLSRILGVPVVGTNARKGEGLKELKDTVQRVASGEQKVCPLRVTYGEAVEKAISVLQPAVEKLAGGRINSRWTALRMIDGETDIWDTLCRYLNPEDPRQSRTALLEELGQKLSEARVLLRQKEISADVRDMVVSPRIRGKSAVKWWVSRLKAIINGTVKSTAS